MTMPKQFSLLHLLLAVAAVAAVLGLSHYGFEMIAVACPAILGGLFGHWRSGSCRGIIPGILGAYKWSWFFGSGLWSWALTGGVLLFLTTWAIYWSDAWFTTAAMLFVALMSIVGGCTGGAEASE